MYKSVTCFLCFSREMSSQTSSQQIDHDEFVHMSIGQLKDYLSLRGLNTTGTKAVLVSRAFVAAENKVPMKYSEDQQRKIIEEEYIKRLSNFMICDPNKSSKVCIYQDDVSKWPKTDTGKIFEYILKCKDQEIDYIGKYKTQKAYSYFASNMASSSSDA